MVFLRFMRRMRFLAAVAISLLPIMAWGASGLPTAMTTSTVFIANYNSENAFTGWGSGFFVDDAIIVTNKHVIQAGDWYRIYATGADEAVNLNCFKAITKSDVKINLDDDVAYMRAYLPCDHGKMNFAEDPQMGDAISVMGFPYKGSLEASMQLTVTHGEVIGRSTDGWFLTDAHLDIGSSGGPVVIGSEVAGVAVAKGVDDQGEYLAGYFIPSSVILSGLLYANDPHFGYTPSSRSSSSRSSSALSSSVSSVSSSRSSISSQSSVTRSSPSSRRSSTASAFPDVPPSLAGYEAIASLRDRGVISGYPDGTFRPYNGINRAEFIKILVAGFRGTEVKGETHCFSDVSNEWFAPYVCAAKRLGWIGGYSDGTFRPAQEVNRAEAMKIVVEAFGAGSRGSVDVPSDVRLQTWFYSYVAAGVNIGIVDPRVLFHPERILTREVAAMWIDTAARSDR